MSDNEQKLATQKLLEERAKRILISIVVVSFVLLVAIVIVSVIISYLRHEVSTASLSFDVGNPLVWQKVEPFTVCDPYDVQSGKYRLNFYCGSSPFVHAIIISQGDTELAKIIVPQDTPPSDLTYSYILPKPGTYLIKNFSNSQAIGQFEFSYPNPCTLTHV